MRSVDWRPLEVSPVFTAVRYLLKILCLAAAFVVCAARGEPQNPAARWIEYSVLLCLVLLVSPITWTHYHCALVSPLSLYGGRGLFVPLTRPWAAAVFLAGLVISLPVVLSRPGNPLLAELTTRVIVDHQTDVEVALTSGAPQNVDESLVFGHPSREATRMPKSSDLKGP